MTALRLIAKPVAAAGLAALLASLWLASAPAGEDGKADVVLRNGKIYTANSARSIEQAIAFSGNTILAVGDDADVETLIGPKTKVVDLGLSSSCPASSTRTSIRSLAPSTTPNAALPA